MGVYQMARDYQKEYQTYHASEEQKKRRAARNKSNRIMNPGPGQDVHHKDGNPLNMAKSNMVVMSRSKNRAMNQRK
jgi:hypothetical protein